MEFTLWGAVGVGILGLATTILEYFYGGPHMWRQHGVKFGRRAARLLRLFVVHTLLALQAACLERAMAQLVRHDDFIVLRHKWDETWPICSWLRLNA